jgi:hypothetical protein
MHVIHAIMSMLRMTIRNVAITMLMLILIMPATVHAYTLEVLGAETTHGVGGGCHDANSDADHDSTGNHPFEVRCCELDIPYILPSAQYLTTPNATGKLACPFNGRQLDGYAKRICKPPQG